MADSRLISYIQQQLRNGYDANTIRNALLQNNYPLQEINAAFRAIEGVSQQQIQQLAASIKQNLAKGYSPQQIQQFLVQSGFSAAAVASAFQLAVKKRFPAKTLLLVFLSLLIIGVIAATAWYFMNIKTTEVTEPEFSISLDIGTLAPGDILYISNEFIHFPEHRDYPITIYYVINDKTQTRIDSWQISMGTTNALLKNTKYTIPRTTTAGTYSLDATMNYGRFSKQASVSFTVSVKKEEITAAEQRSEEKIEESVETTYETTVSGQDDYKNLASAKEIAATNPASATLYCDMISTQTKKDECYWNVAKLSGDKTYCQAVVADHTRDACWIGFAFDKNDYTVCGNIANPFIKQSCEQLKKVAELKAMQGAG